MKLSGSEKKQEFVQGKYIQGLGYGRVLCSIFWNYHMDRRLLNFDLLSQQ